MKIVFLDAGTMGGTSLAPIAALGELVTYDLSTRELALERVADAEVLIVNKVKVGRTLMDAAPRLKLICVAATGINNIDVNEAAERGIPVRNVAGYSTDSVAQLVWAQILSLTCEPARYDAAIKSGAYTRSGNPTMVSDPYRELAGKTMGIVGMGAIGRKVAAIAEAFGMSVIYYSTTGTSHCAEYPSVSLEQLLRSSDVVSFHCPLNCRTNGLVGRVELRLMKPDAILVNMARGGVVDEQALADAVSEGVISGAAVDVFTSEPIPLDHPYLHTSRPERLRLTPHIAWAARESLDRLVVRIAENIEKGW